MGTTCMEKPKNVKEYLTKLGTWENEKESSKVLDLAIVRLRTAYGAVERINKETGERYVFALVVAISFYRGDDQTFCYKDMSEDMGPYQAECPERILHLLTPTDQKYAVEWRANCRAYHERVKASGYQVLIGDKPQGRPLRRLNAAYRKARRLAYAGQRDDVFVQGLHEPRRLQVHRNGAWFDLEPAAAAA